MLLLLRGILILCSLVGYCATIERQMRVRYEFAPLITAGWMIAFLYPCAMAGLLVPGVYLFAALGAVLFARICFLKGALRSHIQSVANPGTLLLLAAQIALIAVLSREHFEMADDFRHWGRLVNFLLRTDRLPGPDDAIILYKDYASATSLFNYAMHRLLGLTPSDGSMMAIQSLLTMSCVLPLRAALSMSAPSEARPSASVSDASVPGASVSGASVGKAPLGRALLDAAFCSLALILCLRGIKSLSVDTLIGLAAASAFCALYVYADAPRKGLIAAIPILILTVLIKDSGLFPALLSLFALAAAKAAKKEKARRAVCALLPALLLFALWKTRSSLIFPVDMEHHTFSFSRYATIVSSRNLSLLFYLIKRCLFCCVNGAGALRSIGQSYSMLALWGVLALGVVPLLRARDKKERRTLLRAIVGAALVFALYHVVLAFAYFISFSEFEARQTASLYRYAGTSAVYLSGALLVVYAPILARPPRAEKRRRAAYMPLVSLALCVCVALFAAALSLPNKYAGGTYEAEERIRARVDLSQREMYYLSAKENKDPGVVFSYLLLHDVRGCADAARFDDADALLREAAGCDSLIVLQDAPSISALLEPLLGARDSYVGLYEISGRTLTRIAAPDSTP